MIYPVVCLRIVIKYAKKQHILSRNKIETLFSQLFTIKLNLFNRFRIKTLSKKIVLTVVQHINYSIYQR